MACPLKCNHALQWRRSPFNAFYFPLFCFDSLSSEGVDGGEIPWIQSNWSILLLKSPKCCLIAALLFTNIEQSGATLFSPQPGHLPLVFHPGDADTGSVLEVRAHPPPASHALILTSDRRNVRRKCQFQPILREWISSGSQKMDENIRAHRVCYTLKECSSIFLDLIERWGRKHCRLYFRCTESTAGTQTCYSCCFVNITVVPMICFHIWYSSRESSGVNNNNFKHFLCRRGTCSMKLASVYCKCPLCSGFSRSNKHVCVTGGKMVSHICKWIMFSLLWWML